MSVDPENAAEHVIALITRHQTALYAHIVSLLPDRMMADDVLQETNLVIWRKAKEYDHGKPFMPWACRIAWFQVKAAKRDAARNPCIFDPDLIDLLAAEDEPSLESTDRMNRALRDCLDQLPAEKRDLILNRYRNEEPVSEMAARQNLSANALSAKLHRIRLMLESCIAGKLHHSPRP